MILNFSAPPWYLNIDFASETFNRDFQPEAYYIRIADSDYLTILGKVQRAGYRDELNADHVNDLPF